MRSAIKRDMLKVILPPALAAVLFLTTIFAITLPGMRQSLLSQRQREIEHLTQIAVSLLESYKTRVDDGELTLQEAQARAAARVENLRYGPEGKDYFWINDMHPRMIMHPYCPELNGTDLADYQDVEGKHLFVEFARVVQSSGHGFVPYHWQWKDQPERIERKKSYVQGFAPWGWIIGTGIYMEDVEADIAGLTRNVGYASAGTLILVLLLLFFIARQHIHSVRKRSEAELALRRSEADLRAKARELFRSNQELEQVAYIASHDLREPLRMIVSYLQLLSRRHGQELGSGAREYIEFAISGARRMDALISDLLAYSRVGGADRKPSDVNSGEALEAALANLKSAVQESGAEITVGALPAVSSDKVELTQVFQNLISNAIKFCRQERPRIRIDARLQNDGVLFSIGDNGIGIEPPYQERIFTMFQRLHGRDEYPGTGIGLALCKKIVERSGGRIWVESTPGEGSTFYFILPAAGTRAVPLEEDLAA